MKSRGFSFLDLIDLLPIIFHCRNLMLVFGLFTEYHPEAQLLSFLKLFIGETKMWHHI